MPRTSHQSRIGEPAGHAIKRALAEHQTARQEMLDGTITGGYDPASGPLSDKAEQAALDGLEEPDDLAFEGAKVSRDPETGRFTRAPSVQDQGLAVEDFFALKGDPSVAQQAALDAGFRRAARAKGWRVDA